MNGINILITLDYAKSGVMFKEKPIFTGHSDYGETENRMTRF